MSAHSSPGPRATATPILEGRTSLDTLADRLGLVDLEDKRKKPRPKREKRERTESRPRPSRPKQKSLSCCLCFSIPIEQPQPRPARPQPRPVQPTTAPMPSKGSSKYRPTPVSSQIASPAKSSRKSTASHTAQIKDFIPDSLDAPTASALMAELARPHLESEEPGFIYMFWLTPTSDTLSAPPPVDAARSLLSPPSPSNRPRSRRPSAVVSSFAAADPSTTSSSTMLLKIGRASNVQRRLNQWQRQCGHEVEMLRYYPYLAGSQESSGAVPHMTPHVKRVERLVHIELSGMGLRKDNGKCEACGREHREWFEVEATREGVKAVDRVIRRWVEWDETRA